MAVLMIGEHLSTILTLLLLENVVRHFNYLNVGLMLMNGANLFRISPALLAPVLLVVMPIVKLRILDNH